MNVDVIVPVHNGARFVRRAIGSALDQRVRGTLTVWCIDDASTDDSIAVLIAAAAADERIRVLRNDSNRGVAATRNRGVRETSGEFIAFLDQDDRWWPDKLERQLSAIEAEPALGYVVGLQQIELDEGQERPAWARAEWFERPQLGYLPSSLLVRRTTFLELGYFDESMSHGGDDTDWFLRALRRGIPHRMLDVPVTTRYVHNSNVSSQFGSNEELLAVVRRHIATGGSVR